MGPLKEPRYGPEDPGLLSAGDLLKCQGEGDLWPPSEWPSRYEGPLWPGEA